MRIESEDKPTQREHNLMRKAEEAERDMDVEPGTEVPVRVVKGGRDIFALRVGADELDEIADAAEAAGVSVGAFIRQAALEKARRQEGAVLKQVRQQVKQLADTVERL